MAYAFLDRLSSPGVIAAQSANGARRLWATAGADRQFDRLGDAEAAFIAARDSLYMATVSQTGWPYVQHRGGPPGFVRMLDATTLAFADFRGNRQYISLGNLADDDRVSLILVDYAARARLKILARLSVRDLAADSALAEALALPGYRATPERAFVLRLEAFDWNCPQHITPRWSAAEVEIATAPLRARLAELEAENARLRGHMASLNPPGVDP